jgi:hypothetical protein
LISLLLISSILVSARADSPLVPTPAALQEARRLYSSLRGDQMHSIYIERMTKSVIEAIMRVSGQSEEKVRPAVEKFIVPDLRAMLGPIQEKYVEILAEHLSVDDMLQVEAFEHSPAGLRINAARTLMAREMYDAQDYWLKQGWSSIYDKHKKELEDAGIILKGTAP